MELTETQKSCISQYVREIEEKIGDQLSSNQRERALLRLRARIDEKIKAASDNSHEEVDVVALLNKMGQPETQAVILVRVWGDASEVRQAPESTAGSDSEKVLAPESPRPAQPATKQPSGAPIPSKINTPTQKEKHAVWLGVARYLAQRFNLPLWALRTLFVLVGVSTGPIAILAYMLAFIVLRLRQCVTAPAPFHPFRVVLHPALTGGMITLFHFAGIYVLVGIRLLHEKYLDSPVPELEDWAWLEITSGSMFLYTLIFLMPLSLLSAMPLAHHWDYSIKRFTQAGVALYAIVISFGLASFVTGIILNFVKEFAS